MTEFNAVEVLTGLAPSLVHDLAGLAGSAEEDLLVSFQIMPWGDRATLAAYGVIDLDEHPGRRGRVARVAPTAVDLVNAAVEVLEAESDTSGVGATRENRGNRAALLAAAALPLVDVVDVHPRSAGLLTVPGTIEKVSPDSSFDRVLVRVPLHSDQADSDDHGPDNWSDSDHDAAPSDDVHFELASRAVAGRLTRGARVRLYYTNEETPIQQPDALQVEPA